MCYGEVHLFSYIWSAFEMETEVCTGLNVTLISTAPVSIELGLTPLV